MCFSSVKAQKNNEALPSMAFLEYLAEMTEINGQLYGPQDLANSCHQTTAKRDKNKDESNNGQGAELPPDENATKPMLDLECINND